MYFGLYFKYYQLTVYSKVFYSTTIPRV